MSRKTVFLILVAVLLIGFFIYSRQPAKIAAAQPPGLLSISSVEDIGGCNVEPVSADGRKILVPVDYSYTFWGLELKNPMDSDDSSSDYYKRIGWNRYRNEEGHILVLHTTDAGYDLTTENCVIHVGAGE